MGRDGKARKQIKRVKKRKSKKILKDRVEGGEPSCQGSEAKLA